LSSVLDTFIQTVWQILSESAFWVLLSLAVGGLVHEFLPASRFRQLLNRNGISAMFSAVLFGACLPICSCGVIPLAISLFKSGIRLGPVMAFAAATPIINPAAVILSLALLGPQITAAYVALGLVLPLLLGFASERWGDQRVVDFDAMVQPDSPDAQTPGEGALGRVIAALRWGFADLGPTIGFYLGIGVLLAGLLSAFLPQSWIDMYLRESSGLALLAAGLLGASIYVCAVAHIPLVATLLATGAAPGITIVFLVTGTATNLPELIALYNTIGKRTVVVYTSMLVTGAIIAGVAVNAWLLPDFTPVFDPLESLDLLDTGERLQPAISSTLSLAATFALVGLAGWGTMRRVTARLRSSSSDGCCTGSGSSSSK
jgi:uncharacterized membrane protein YraQ (UPF0718 family)